MSCSSHIFVATKLFLILHELCLQTVAKSPTATQPTHGSDAQPSACASQASSSNNGIVVLLYVQSSPRRKHQQAPAIVFGKFSTLVTKCYKPGAFLKLACLPSFTGRGWHALLQFRPSLCPLHCIPDLRWPCQRTQLTCKPCLLLPWLIHLLSLLLTLIPFPITIHP